MKVEHSGKSAAATRRCVALAPIFLGVPALLALLAGGERPATEGAVPQAVVAAADIEGTYRPDWYPEYRQAARLSEWLDQRLAEAWQRRQSKKQLAQALAAGRLTLGEALTCWQELGEIHPWQMRALRVQHPAETPEESICLSLIDAAAQEYLHDPDRAIALAARLKAELRQCVQEGTLPRLEVTSIPGSRADLLANNP